MQILSLEIYLPLYRKRVLDALDLDDCVRLGQRDVDCLTLFQLPGVGSVGQVVPIGDAGGAGNQDDDGNIE